MSGEKPEPWFTMDDIRAELELEDPDPNALTIPEWVRKLGRSRWIVRKRIYKKIEEGTWVKVPVERSGRHYDGYRPKTQEELDE